MTDTIASIFLMIPRSEFNSFTLEHCEAHGDLCHDEDNDARCDECGVMLGDCSSCTGAGYHRAGCLEAGTETQPLALVDNKEVNFGNLEWAISRLLCGSPIEMGDIETALRVTSSITHGTWSDEVLSLLGIDPATVRDELAAVRDPVQCFAIVYAALGLGTMVLMNEQRQELQMGAPNRSWSYGGSTGFGIS